MYKLVVIIFMWIFLIEFFWIFFKEAFIIPTILSILLLLFKKSFVKVSATEVVIVERKWKYWKTLDSGVHFILPFVDNIKAHVYMGEQILPVQPQDIVTKDNIATKIDIVVFLKVIQPEKTVYEIRDLQEGISYITKIAVHDIISEINSDSILSSKKNISDQLLEKLNFHINDNWGCIVNHIEITNISF